MSLEIGSRSPRSGELHRLRDEWCQLDLESLARSVGDEAASWARALGAALADSRVDDFQQRGQCLAERAEALGASMDFSFLYKPEHYLFGIGYNLTLGKLDVASYDLLASEACLTSFLAVARGDAPAEHWFHLGRLAGV